MRGASSLLLLFALLVACGEPAPPTDDGGAVDAPTTCGSDEDCDDGVFCNGAELCLPRSPLADARGCAVEGERCVVGTVCNEDVDRCVLDCAVDTDADGDGVDAPECGGTDCDDGDDGRYPGATETCDPDGVDEDCDERTFGERDLDGDGFFDARCCNLVADGPDVCGDDCDDEDAARHPTEAETCNEVDDDCDGTTDEKITSTYVVDADRDGHGDAASGAATIVTCRPPSGYAASADDCDDAAGSVHPGAFDRCEDPPVDDDCSGTPNDPPGGCACTGTESRSCPLPGLCGASVQTCISGRWPDACPIVAVAEVCGNGLDEDCDGTPDDGCVCDEETRFCGTEVGACMRGIQICTSDGEWTACMDAVGPSPETCNEIDDDCDGVIDDGFVKRCFADADGDGYTVPGVAVMEVCAPSCPGGFTARDPAVAADRDCDVADARVHPGSGGHGTPSTSRGFDFDCDGVVEVVSLPGVDCSARPDGTCGSSGGGRRTVGACGSRTELFVCATMGGDSSGWRCEERVVCTAAEDCGDENRTVCR